MRRINFHETPVVKIGEMMPYKVKFWNLYDKNHLDIAYKDCE